VHDHTHFHRNVDTNDVNIDRGVSRRRALGLLAGATATSVIAACNSSSSHPVTTPTGSGSPPPSPTRSPTPTHSATSATAADWRSLRRSLTGPLKRPGNPGYNRARILFDRRFDGITPQGVARVESSADIAQCLAFAQRFGVPLQLRSGGHSYIGASIGPGLVIDLRSLDGVTVNQTAGTATIGAGAALVDVYAQLADQGVSIPAGSCPTVGLSGLTLGGGIGVVTRRYGLTCDRLIEADVVVADGSTLTCNATSHPDLYWALRGGGGSFGVVTSMTLGTHAADPLAHAFVAWPWSAATEVLTAWQPWATSAPHSLWSSVHTLATDGDGPPTISVAAVMVDSSSALQQHVGRLVQAVPTTPTTNFLDSAGYEYTMMLESGCAQLSVTSCHVADETPGGTLPRDAFVAGSDFFNHFIPAAGIGALVQAVERRQADPRLGAGGASFDTLGGAVDKLKPTDTAWVHRGALFDAQYTASWGTTPGNGPLARNQHSLASIHNAVRPYGTGGAYQNYADDTLPNPQQAYYGVNLPRLIEVRRAYDLKGLFTQPQGVPLS
jgi:FAD/FMN-containing dehydrogenase